MKILLTGTSSGIGQILLEYLAKKNHEVFVINRRPTIGPYVKEFVCDLSNPQELSQLELELKKIYFDALINNAASGKVKRFNEVDLNNLSYEFNLNTFSPIILIKYVLKNMQKQKHGKILNISSISAKEGTPYLYTYSASKAALDSFTQSLAKTYTKDGISINSFCLGGIETHMSIEGRKQISLLHNLTEEQYQDGMISKMGLNKLISPKDLAEFLYLYLSVKTDIISGQTINICGTLELR